MSCQISSPRIFLALFLLFAVATCASAQARRDVATSTISQAPYVVGEKLSYNVSFSHFPTAAHVELLVVARAPISGRDAIELRAHVETIGVVSAALYSINNDYVSFVDPSTGVPYRTRQVIREGIRTEEITNDLNQSLTAPSGQASSGVFDLVSALYRLRALPLQEGAIYNINVQHGSRVFDAELRVTGRQTVKTNVGSSATFVTQVRVRNDSAGDGYKIRVWFTDDERHVPVLITARHAAGEIRAELASSEIVKEPVPLVADQPPTPAGPPRTIPLPPSPGTVAGEVEPRVRSTPTPPVGTTPLPELPFSVGERLNFNFYVGKGTQPIGVASFHVRNRANYFNRDGLLLSSSMQTSAAMLGVFPVNNQINSYVDSRTLLPFRTELSMAEGKRQDKWIVSLNQDGGNALFNDGTRVEIPVGTHDLLSVLYALRSFDLTPAKRNAVALLINKRPRLLHINALRRDTIQLGTEKIPAIELSLTTDEPAAERLAIRLWVSSDRRRLPLRITAETPLGPVRADLAIIPTTLQ